MRNNISNVLVHKQTQFQETVHMFITTHYLCHPIHSSITTYHSSKCRQKCRINVRTARNFTSWRLSVSSPIIHTSNPGYISFRYRLTAGTNNTHNHFTAILHTPDDRYVRFNDLHPQGCFPLDAMIYVDFAIYALII